MPDRAAADSVGRSMSCPPRTARAIQVAVGRRRRRRGRGGEESGEHIRPSFRPTDRPTYTPSVRPAVRPTRTHTARGRAPSPSGCTWGKSTRRRCPLPLYDAAVLKNRKDLIQDLTWMQFNNQYAFISYSLGSFQHTEKLLWPCLLVLPLREKADSPSFSLSLCFCLPRPSNERASSAAAVDDVCAGGRARRSSGTQSAASL